MADGNTSRTRTRNCKHCGQSFSYPIARGLDRKYCGDFCRSRVRAANMAAQPLCVVEGCSNPRQYSNGICNGCYCRLRRTGTLDRRVLAYRSLHSNGYVKVKDVSHPLADSDGYIYEHRKVLYDAVNGMDQPCHWCGTVVVWKAGQLRRGESKNRLVADHLDGVKVNNDVSNLVAACNRCNVNRGLFMSWVSEHKDDPVLWRMYLASREA